jgi:hypothetical protein
MTLHESETCWYCGDGEPVAMAGPDDAATCARCLDAFQELGSADTVPCPAAVAEREVA